MTYNEERQRLVEAGFTGFTTIGALMADTCAAPAAAGVYVVMRNDDGRPTFTTKGTGGFFNQKDPNVSIDELERNWVDDTSIVYIGKAGGPKSGATLRSRLRQYMEFGQGKPIGHYGGRYIWQLQDARELTVCWKVIGDKDPRDVENQMIAMFKVEHGGRRPFANLKD